MKRRVPPPPQCLYCALVCKRPLLLLDEPFAALDWKTKKQLCGRLFGARGLVTRSAAAVVCTSDPAVLHLLQPSTLLVLRGGRSVGYGGFERVLALGLEELPAPRLSDADVAQEQEEPCDEPGGAPCAPAAEAQPHGRQTEDEEKRQRGHVQASVYRHYGEAVGWWRMAVILASILGIMVFQQLSDVWLAFWTNDSPDKRFVSASGVSFSTDAWADASYLRVYAWLVLAFCVCNFAGFWLEIWGGVLAARLGVLKLCYTGYGIKHSEVI